MTKRCMKWWWCYVAFIASFIIMTDCFSCASCLFWITLSWNNHHYHLTFSNNLLHSNWYDRALIPAETKLQDSRVGGEGRFNSHLFLTSSGCLLTNLYTTLPCWNVVNLKLFTCSIEGIKFKSCHLLSNNFRSFNERKNRKHESYALITFWKRQ